MPVCYSAATYLTFHLFTAVLTVASACAWINVRAGPSAFTDLVQDHFLPTPHSACSAAGALVLVLTILMQLVYAIIIAGNLTLSSAGLACQSAMPSLWSLTLADSILVLLLFLIPALLWVPSMLALIFSFARGVCGGSSQSPRDEHRETALSIFTLWNSFVKAIVYVHCSILAVDLIVYPNTSDAMSCGSLSTLLLVHIFMIIASIMGTLLWSKQPLQVESATSLDIAPSSQTVVPMVGSGIMVVSVSARCFWSIAAFFILASTQNSACESAALVRFIIITAIIELVCSILVFRFWFPRIIAGQSQALFGEMPDELLASEVDSQRSSSASSSSAPSFASSAPAASMSAVSTHGEYAPASSEGEFL